MPGETRLHPPAMRARRVALGLSFVSVSFSFAFALTLRKFWGVRAREDVALLWLTGALALLLVALVLRILAAICELLWLERTWTNLPEELRRVGPVDKVDSVMVIGLSVVPVLAWFWKLGLVVGVSNGLETVRSRVPFRAPVPKRLGIAAVILGWFPPLNIYLAPFLWEMFARRIDRVILELGAR